MRLRPLTLCLVIGVVALLVGGLVLIGSTGPQAPGSGRLPSGDDPPRDFMALPQVEGLAPAQQGRTPDAGRRPAIRFTVPYDVRAFAAEMVPTDSGDGQCTYPARVSRRDGGYVLHPAGPAGTYRTLLQARRESADGSLVNGVQFDWTTPERRGAEAWVRLERNHADLGTGAGLTLVLDRALIGRSVTATARVVGDDGRTTAFGRLRRDQSCDDPAFAELVSQPSTTLRMDPDAPYRVEVDLRVDGRSHRATGTWQPLDPGTDGDVLLEAAPRLR